MDKINASIKTQELGKLRNYMIRNDKLASGRFIHKLFPKGALQGIIDAAKMDGIMNANIFQTHAGFTKNGKFRGASLLSTITPLFHDLLFLPDFGVEVEKESISGWLNAGACTAVEVVIL